MSIARRLLPIIAGAGVLLSLACRETPPPPPAALRLTLAQADELVADDHTASLFGRALAPDGRRLVLSARPARAASPLDDRTLVTQLWIRDLSTGTVTPLAGTEGGLLPFWSPDGARMGFFASGRLRALDLASGRLDDLAAAPAPRGGAWHADGEIVFAPSADGALVRRRADGTLDPFTTLQDGESSHRLPGFLGADHVVFFVRAREAARQGVWVTRRDDPSVRRRLISSDAAALALDSTLFFASGEALMAQRVNLETLAFEGRALLIGTPVGRDDEHQIFATIGGDMLLYGVPASPLRRLQWVDRTGAPAATLGEPMIATDVRIAPQGGRVAVARVDRQLGTLDIWTYDDRRPIPRRLSPAIDADDAPAWSPDGRRVAWVSGRRQVVVRESEASAPESVVWKGDQTTRVTGWSPDGRTLVLSALSPGTGVDILLLPMATAGARGPAVYAAAPFNETDAVVSPDGRWLAYASDESGAMEIYADRFPAPGARARLSIGGGREPRWARDGRTLFFRRGRAVHMVTLEVSGHTIAAVASETLFDAGADIRAYDVAPGEQRFLLNLPHAEGVPAPLSAVVHVRSLLPSAP